MKPQHAHDSDCCTFLGRVGSADMWMCQNGYGTTYMLRYSSDGCDYFSSRDFGNRKQGELRKQISGGDDLYYQRMTGIHLCATGITNIMKGE